PPATSRWTYLVRSESSSFEFDPSFSPDIYSSIYFPATDTRLTVTPTISFTPAEPTCDVQCREEQQRLDDEEYDRKLRDYQRRFNRELALTVALPIG
ncbi:hypothetical protein QBC32DRAFT_193059, partial [Pseudoneurospora amorphoporcata]